MEANNVEKRFNDWFTVSYDRLRNLVGRYLLRPELFFRGSVRLGSGLAFLSMPSNPETVICRLEGVVGLKVLIDISRYTPSVYQTMPSKNSMVLVSAASWT